MRKPALLSLVLITLSTFGSLAHASDALDQLQRANQAQFRAISEDLGSALSYKSLTPAEPLGALGFDLGVEVTATSVKNKALIEQVSSSSIPSTVPVPKLHVHKGLPGGFDVGLSYSAVPSLGVSLIGGELRYAILQGSVATPAVSVRGSFSKLSGVDQLKFDTKAIDVSISKGFLNFTPYAGIGQVWVNSTPQGVPLLKEESFTQTKVFAGANVNFGVFNLLLEIDQTGKAVSYGGKLGWRF
ncbi:MAG: hypothetical protein ACRCV9_13050 [Burkholderiaceae bacterium]